jgi:hypothetical protein
MTFTPSSKDSRKTLENSNSDFLLIEEYLGSENIIRITGNDH